MANLETEQKAPLAPPEGGDSPSASVALNEENLEALLKAVTAPAQPASAGGFPAEPAPAIATPVEVPRPPASDSGPAVHADEWHSAEVAEAGGTPEPERPAEAALEEARSPDVAPAAEARQQPAVETTDEASKDQTDVEAERLPERPVRESAREVMTPVAESPQEVASKLALLSSIKQRRSVAVRPDFGNTAATEPEIAAPSVLPTKEALAETARVAMETVQQDASISKDVPKDAAKSVEQPVDLGRSVSDKLPAGEKQGLAAEKEPAQYKVRGSTWPASKSGAFSVPASNTLFAPADKDASGKLKSFATSGVGMAVIGGTVLAVGLTAYLLTGHATKPKRTVSSPNLAMTASVPSRSAQTPSGQTGSVPTPGASTSPPVSPASSAVGKPPLGGTVPSGTSRPEDPKKEAKTEAAQTAKPAVPPAPANPGPAPAQPSLAAQVDAPRTVARPFAPPAVGTRPADATIVEAPPTLSGANSPAPAAVTLPTGIAPLAPPPPSAPKAPSAPRQISVTGKVQAAKLARQVTPTYPALAKATRVQGVVRFRATIATDGQVKSLVVLGGPPPLVQGATDAVKQWRYQPTLINGEAVEVVTDIEVAFTL